MPSISTWGLDAGHVWVNQFGITERHALLGAIRSSWLDEVVFVASNMKEPHEALKTNQNLDFEPDLLEFVTYDLEIISCGGWYKIL